MTIIQYFSKVKSHFHEIAKLDLDSNILEKHVKRIIIHGLRLEYKSFIATIQNWLVKLTILELENLLANQGALAKQLVGSIY